jgi:tRNA(fMet)-specific endonuclease VapC
MSLFLLDTNICIFLLNQRPGFERIVQHMHGRNRGEIGISSISVAELEFGAAASQRPGDNFHRLERFLLDFEALPFEREAARSYGPLRAQLQAQGTPIGPLDFLIAAHALALPAVLISNNTREFQRVPGLALQDWTFPL